MENTQQSKEQKHTYESLYPRRYLPIPDRQKSEVEQGLGFTFMTYNLLGQTLIRRDTYPYCSNNCLKWGTRKLILLKEILHLSTDVICFQEMDFYDEWWKPQLEQKGYDSVWLKKAGNKKDGCGIFWKRDKFKMLEYEEVHFNDLAEGTTGVETEELTRDNVAQLVLLKDVNSNQGFICSTTHLFWNPKYSYVRLRQVEHLLTRVMAFKAKFDIQYPVVMGGDFNFWPHGSDYSVLTERMFHRIEKNIFLTPKNHYSKYINHLLPPPIEVLQAEVVPRAQTDEEIEERLEKVEEVYKLLERLPVLDSVFKNYFQVDPNAKQTAKYHDKPKIEPPFTTYTPIAKLTLDYVFNFQPEWCVNDQFELDPVALLEIPSDESLSIQTALPNDYLGSDHISVACKFVLRPKSTK